MQKRQKKIYTNKKMQSRLKKAQKAQISMEYLAIFATAALMTLPLIIIFATQSGNIQSDITNTQANKAASLILSAAEEVYFMGAPSQKTVRIQFPNGVESVNLTGTNIIMTIETRDITYDIAKDARFNVTGTIKTFEGPHTLTFKAILNNVTQQTYVSITDK